MNSSVLIQPYGTDTSLVFGLEWETLVGANVERQSYKRAAAHKASHYVRAGRHSSAVGYGHLNEKGKRKLYSAAAIFAQAHSHGVFLEKLELPEDQYWVVAAQSGLVISGTDKICTAEEADELIESLTSRYPHIVHITTDETQFSHYLNDKSVLHDVRSLIERTPPWARYAVGAMLALILADLGWGEYKSYQANKERQRLAAQHVDSDALWIETIDQWQQGITLHGRTGLVELYNNVGNIPLNIGSWKLSEVACAAVAAGWQCSAQYARFLGSNLSFKHNAPKGWDVQWNGLSGAVGNWLIPHSGNTLDRTKLENVNDISVDYISKLQSALPSFITYTLENPTVVSITDPVVTQPNGSMRSYPYPGENSEALKLPKTFRFKLEAPLRSLTVLPLLDSSAIHSIRFVHKPETGGQSLTRSAFVAQLAGEFYAQ